MEEEVRGPGSGCFGESSDGMALPVICVWTEGGQNLSLFLSRILNLVFVPQRLIEFILWFLICLSPEQKHLTKFQKHGFTFCSSVSWGDRVPK
jgi:hypothetical protein